MLIAERTVWLTVGIWWAQWLSGAQSSGPPTRKSRRFDAAVNAKRAEAAVNCTRYVPDEWRQWMRAHEPLDEPASSGGGKMLAPLEYLFACLQAELPHVNETSPFSLTPSPRIEYEMALHEVVSLGFNGILATKALEQNSYSTVQHSTLT